MTLKRYELKNPDCFVIWNTKRKQFIKFKYRSHCEIQSMFIKEYVTLDEATLFHHIESARTFMTYSDPTICEIWRIHSIEIEVMK